MIFHDDDTVAMKENTFEHASAIELSMLLFNLGWEEQPNSGVYVAFVNRDTSTCRICQNLQQVRDFAQEIIERMMQERTRP